MPRAELTKVLDFDDIGDPPVAERGLYWKRKDVAVTLSSAQRESWLKDGYFVIPDALSADQTARLMAAVDETYARYLRTFPEASRSAGAEISTAIEYHDEFRELIDNPRTFPLIVDLLGPYIHLYISVCTARPPNPGSPGFLHTDGGEGLQNIRVTDDSRPLQAKVHYFLTATPAEDHGDFTVVPGSHHRKPHWKEGYEPTAGEIDGKRQLLLRAGDAVVFSHQLGHGAVRNVSNVTRRTVTFGYRQLFIPPADCAVPSQGLLARCTPRRRRLLGDLGELTMPAGYLYYSPAHYRSQRYYNAPGDQVQLIAAEAQLS